MSEELKEVNPDHSFHEMPEYKKLRELRKAVQEAKDTFRQTRDNLLEYRTLKALENSVQEAEKAFDEALDKIPEYQKVQEVRKYLLEARDAFRQAWDQSSEFKRKRQKMSEYSKLFLTVIGNAIMAMILFYFFKYLFKGC